MKAPVTTTTREATLDRLQDAIAAIETNEDCGIVLILMSMDRVEQPMPHVYSSSGRPKAGYVMKALALKCAALGRTLEQAAVENGFDPAVLKEVEA